MSRQIVWDDLDKQKYYFYGCSVFLGIRVLVYPTNTIKTRLQVQKGQGHYTGTYDAFCKVFKREGLLGFYRGFHIFALGVIFGQAYITAYEFTKHKCCDLPIFLQGLIPGAAASIAGQSLSVPTDVITQRLQIQGMLKKQEMGSAKGSKLNLTEATVKKHKNRHSVMSVINKIMKYDGITGFYRGFFVSLISNVPTSAIWWAAYNVLLETIGRFTTPDEQGHNKMPIQAMCGVLSGAISAVSTNSLDVIRTRIQVAMSTTEIKDRFSQSPDSYLESHHVIPHLVRALTSLLAIKDSDPKLHPFRYLSDYFASISSGQHVIHQEYSYIEITSHNRTSFVKLFWKSYKSIGNHGDLLTAKEYHALIQLLCHDFPFTIVQSAARIILMDDAISDCLMAFQDFLYAFQVQFCYNEFLNACRELYLSLSSEKSGNSTPRLEGVESSKFLDGITSLISKYHHPPIRVIHRILSKSQKTSFYTYLLGVANSDTINSTIGVLPKKSLCLENDAKSTKSE